MNKTASTNIVENQQNIRALARECFEEELAKCEYGVAHIYSTQPGNSADDLSSFTRCMIEGASERILQLPQKEILSIREATAIAASMLKQHHIMQIPTYNAGRRYNHFPFAINI